MNMSIEEDKENTQNLVFYHKMIQYVNIVLHEKHQRF